MTTWSWTCRACDFEFQNPIFRYISKCPECEVEYVRLASANGVRSIGILPIYAMKNEPITNDSTRNSILFAIALHSNEIECYSREFYEYLQREFSDNLSEKNVSLKLLEKDEK